jgi:hypothetical protein
MESQRVARNMLLMSKPFDGEPVVGQPGDRVLIRAKELTDGSYVFNVEVNADKDIDGSGFVILCAVDYAHAQRLYDEIAECTGVR